MAAEPRPELCANKRLDSLSPNQPPAELVVSTFNLNADIKKRTASMFERRDLSQNVVCIQAPRKFKLITVS
jgi:hypothetical protein